jgi:hypothetical protein
VRNNIDSKIALLTIVRQPLRLIAVIFCLMLMMVWNITWYLPQHTKAVTANMMLFWDPAFGSTPTGWSVITTFDGKFPRGDTISNYGTTGGAGAPYTPTTASVTVGAPSAIANGNGNNITVATNTHTHPAPTVTVGSDSNGDLPAYRSLQLIKYGSGIPTFIPGGAIAMFDTNGSIPSGWTRLSAQDGKMIRVNSSVATGGSDTATNSVTIGSLANSTDAGSGTGTGSGAALNAASHANSAPAAGNTTAVSTLPPYVEPQLAQANADTATISVAIVAMFDGDPGTGWQVVSGSGGAYNQQFLRPAATASLTSQGATTHTPPSYVVASGATTTASPGNSKNNGGATNSLQSHTHDITVTFNSVSNFPPYFNVVIAQKVSFTQQAYRWYVDSNTNAVSDPWPTGAFDVAQNTALTVLPAVYSSPQVNDQLRLRIQMLVSGQALPAGNTQFKLQYKQGSDSSCTTGSWTDVGSGAWVYGTNSVSDGATLTSSVLSPASSVLEIFSKSAASGNNPNAISTGQTGEYDFLIKDASAPTSSQYSFRMVETSGSLLSSFTACPTLSTRPDISNEMRHGNFFTEGVEQGFLWAD